MRASSSATRRSSASATGRASRCRWRATASPCSAPARWAARSPPGSSAVGLVVRGWNRRSPSGFDALLAASEIVVCALPLTERDRRHPRRARVRGDAARRLRHQRRARRARRRGRPDRRGALRAISRGAALDVQRREPMPADDPLWTVPGITITPHIAAQPSTETIADQFVASAARARARRAAAERRSTARAATERRRRRSERAAQTPRGGSASSSGRSHGPSGANDLRRRAGSRGRHRGRDARRARASGRSTPGRRPRAVDGDDDVAAAAAPAASAGLSADSRTTRTWPPTSTQLRPSQARLLSRELPRALQLGEDRLQQVDRHEHVAAHAPAPLPPAALPTISEPMPTSSPSALKRPAPLWSVRAGAVKSAPSMWYSQ